MANEGIQIRDLGDSLDVSIVREDHTQVGFFDSTTELVEHLEDEQDIYIVADKKVLDLFAIPLEPLISRGTVFSLDVSEKEKSWDNLASILKTATESKVSRKGAIVAIGGGVITDMAGLASNLYFRGVRSILVPTTLLGMVDAAIGGKVAVNHYYQKNLTGSFYHPYEVLVSTEFLSTVSDRHMYSAAGEIYKLALLSDTDLFSLIEQRPKNWIRNDTYLMQLVKLCIAEKLLMLGSNCFERDLERPLNLGHSVGHPLEDITDFKVLHGEAISYGLLIACNISLSRGLLSLKDYQRIYTAGKNLGCTTNVDNFDRDELWRRIRRLISQRGGKGLLYVLPVAVGKAKIVNDITHDELFNAIDALRQQQLS